MLWHVFLDPIKHNFLKRIQSETRFFEIVTITFQSIHRMQIDSIHI